MRARVFFVLFLVLFTVGQAEAGGIKELFFEYVDAVEKRISAQAATSPAGVPDFSWRRTSDTEELLKRQIRDLLRVEDDVADVAMGYLCEADLGDALLYFHPLIPSGSSCPNARRLLAKMKSMTDERRSEGTMIRPGSGLVHRSAGRETPQPAEIAPAFRDRPFPLPSVREEPPIPDDITPDLSRFTRIADQKPTYYVTQREEGFPVSGPLYGHTYNGTERKQILTPSGTLISETSGRYFAALCMQGSGVIMDGRTVSFVSKQRFSIAPAGCLGITSTGYWVVPFHTLAVNRNQIPYKGVYFVPGTRGLQLPNGQVHDGYWFAHDTGSAFSNTTNRLDMYVDCDSYWKWMEAHFVPSFTPTAFYRVDDATRARVYDKYRSMLGKAVRGR